MRDDFMLPHEYFSAVGVPSRLVTAKYVAIVEAAMKLTGDAPIEVDLNRVQQILDMEVVTTDPRDMVMVVEETEGKDPLVRVRLATIDEIRAANLRYALARMGTRRN